MARSRCAGSAARLAGWLIGCALLAGCTTPGTPGRTAAGYPPENVFMSAPSFMHDLKRVVLLPIACDETRPDLVDAGERFDPVVQAELIKTRRFEVIAASAEVMEIRTGRPTWTGTEVFPAAFFEIIRQVYGADAILFCELTVCRPYAPQAIGWRMKLVDTRTRQTLWAADEVFDAGQPAVVKGLKQYQSTDLENPARDGEAWRLRNSPGRFGQFAAAEVFATLPIR
jgi:hypothetical protein